jgi:hypothetical protein
VVPSTATNQNIVWSVVSGEATISGTTVTPSAAGTLTLKATVTNGATPTVDFPQNFNVTVKPAPVTVTLNSVDADGKVDPFAPTTKITLTFSQSVSGLTKEDITIAAAGASFKKGELTATGGGEYELEVEALLDVGPNAGINVTVTATGATGTQTATLYPWIGIDEELVMDIGTDASLPLGGWYKQTADITITSTWVPIATTEHPFTGVFDGGGFEIKPDVGNVSFVVTSAAFRATDGATIRNVHIGAGSITTSANVLAGIVHSPKNTVIEHCSNAANLKSANASGLAAGIFYASSEGGAGVVTDCWNTGNITGGTRAAGIGVNATYSITVERCYNTGAITCEGAAESATVYAGGIAALVSSGGSIVACYNTGTVTVAEGKLIYAGGITANPAGTISAHGSVTACYNTGTVTTAVAQQSSGKIYMGGIAGYCSSTYPVVTASYSAGEVSYTGTSGSGSNIRVGGVIGYTTYASANTPQSPVITGCYWTAPSVPSATIPSGGIGGKLVSGKTEATSEPSDDGASPFASDAWPASIDSGWGIGNGSASGQYWKSLGSWGSGTPTYPKLWFED